MKTDAELAQELRDLPKDDEEAAHILADNLLCEMLIFLGYEESVAVFGSMTKWYA